MPQISIVIADDHALVRAGIRSLVESLPGVEVLGEAGNGREVFDLVRDLKPTIALMDISMPGLNGLEACKIMTRDFPELKVIILSMHSNEEYVLKALRSGASGYLLKDSATSELDMAIKAVARGETFLSPSVSKHVIDSYRQRINEKGELEDQLTSRQREILQLIAEGNSTKEIAEMLHISVKTVETHRAQMMERLDIHDVPGLVRYAIKQGIITLE